MSDLSVQTHRIRQDLSRRGFMKGALVSAGLLSMSLREAAAQMVGALPGRSMDGASNRA